MAIDRNNQKVSNLYNQLHPSMIQIFKKIADIANTYNVDLSICGEIATNPIAIPLLLGLGIATLSMNSISIPQAKWIIRHIYYSDCQALAIEVLQLSESKDIEKKLIHFFNSNQLHNTILINT
jgi:signal transduction protein with GAF and PtsI domain